jgi:hypothetical protein
MTPIHFLTVIGRNLVIIADDDHELIEALTAMVPGMHTVIEVASGIGIDPDEEKTHIAEMVLTHADNIAASHADLARFLLVDNHMPEPDVGRTIAARAVGWNCGVATAGKFDDRLLRRSGAYIGWVHKGDVAQLAQIVSDLRDGIRESLWPSNLSSNDDSTVRDFSDLKHQIENLFLPLVIQLGVVGERAQSATGDELEQELTYALTLKCRHASFLDLLHCARKIALGCDSTSEWYVTHKSTDCESEASLLFYVRQSGTENRPEWRRICSLLGITCHKGQYRYIDISSISKCCLLLDRLVPGFDANPRLVVEQLAACFRSSDVPDQTVTDIRGWLIQLTHEMASLRSLISSHGTSEGEK